MSKVEEALRRYADEHGPILSDELDEVAREIEKGLGLFNALEDVPPPQKLAEIPQELSLILLNDCLRTLQDVVVYLATDGVHGDKDEILFNATDCMYRGGRL